MSAAPAAVRRALRRVRDDLRADPYLRAILLLALLLAAFGIWHRVPNFATWDARDRLLHPLVVYGHVLAEPSLESFREGLAWSREPFGATFYVYGLALVPVLIVAAITGSLDAIAEIPFHGTDFVSFPAWQGTPEWIWTWGILLSRLVTVAFAVGCVYLTYRIGVAIQDRTTGRLAATLLSLSFGFLVLAKEIGEDVPALFFLLLAIYLLVRYVQTGTRRSLFAASGVGGFALAVKLTMAPIVPLVLVAILVRERSVREDADEFDWRAALWQPRLVATGAAIGAVVMLLGFPSTVAGRFDVLLNRFTYHAGSRFVGQRGPDAPTWWWFLRGYLQGLGLPLAVAAAGGVVAGVRDLRRRGLAEAPGPTVVVAALAIFVGLTLTWREFRVHHLLPTFPLVLLVLSGALARLHDRRPSVARPVVAALVLTTALYAGVGTAQYASMPRDEASAWIEENVPENATMEIYRQSFDEAAVTHDLNVSHPWGDDGEAAPCPEYVQLTYRELVFLRDVPEDHRAWFATVDTAERAAFVRAIVDGETNYELAAEFGPRPPDFEPRRPAPGSVVDVLSRGIWPHSTQYGDEQDLVPDQYVAIFERTGPCEQPRTAPW